MHAGRDARGEALAQSIGHRVRALEHERVPEPSESIPEGVRGQTGRRVEAPLDHADPNVRSEAIYVPTQHKRAAPSALGLRVRGRRRTLLRVA